MHSDIAFIPNKYKQFIDISKPQDLLIYFEYRLDIVFMLK